MSGLSHLETEGCRNLLGLLDNDEIMALCDTVTNRLVQPVDRQGRRAGGRQPPAEGPGRAGDAAWPPGARTRGDAAPAAAARLCSFWSPRSPVPGSRRVARWSCSPCPGPTGYSSGDTMTRYEPAVSHEFQKAPEWILVLRFYHPGNERLLLWLFTFHRKHINTSCGSLREITCCSQQKGGGFNPYMSWNAQSLRPTIKLTSGKITSFFN